jgi:uncharacterized protein
VRSIAVDAGPLIAFFNQGDAHHSAAVAFLRRADNYHLVTTSLVAGEVAAMLCEIQPNLFRFLEWLEAVVQIEDALHDDLPRIVAVMEKYSDLPANFADASLVVLCERRGIDGVATIDRDFDVYRLPRGKKFENVFHA